MQDKNPEEKQAVTVQQWVSMFRTVGLDDDRMHRWHQEFENRHPGGHQSFLEWLQLPQERIAEIRSSSANT